MQSIRACLTSVLPCQQCIWDVLLTGFKCSFLSSFFINLNEIPPAKILVLLRIFLLCPITKTTYHLSLLTSVIINIIIMKVVIMFRKILIIKIYMQSDTENRRPAHFKCKVSIQNIAC